MSRPDILSHRPPRFEHEEIKPDSVAGRADGRLKLAFLEPFYAHFGLPYRPGVTWVPTPEIPLFTLPGPVFAFLSVHRNRPGLVDYNVCVRGEASVLAAYGIAALLLLIILIILTRGRIPAECRGDSVSGACLSPLRSLFGAPAAAGTLQTKLTFGRADDPLEREADAVAQIVGSWEERIDLR